MKTEHSGSELYCIESETQTNGKRFKTHIWNMIDRIKKIHISIFHFTLQAYFYCV